MSSSSLKPSTRQLGGPQRHTVILIAVSIGLSLGLSMLLAGYDPPDADIKFDWLVARESLKAGGDAYRDILWQARDEGVSIAVHVGEGVKKLSGHPRTPGAILLQLPLVAMPIEGLFPLSVFLSVAAVALIATLQVGDRKYGGLALLVAALLTAPLFVTLRFAGHAAIVAAFTLGGWRLIQREHDYLGGAVIGLAAILKVFPAFLILPLVLSKRWKAATSLAATGVVMNLGGLALPGVSLEGAMNAMQSATPTWVGLSSNGSLVSHLIEFGLSGFSAQIVAVVTASALLAVMSRLDRCLMRDVLVSTPFLALAFGLLVVPLSWISYDVVLLPAVMALALNASKRFHLLGLLALGLWAVPVVLWPITIIPTGELSTIVRVLVMVACFAAFRPESDWSISRNCRRQLASNFRMA